MNQSSLEFERQKRDAGMAKAAGANAEMLDTFRGLAVALALVDGVISIADVRDLAAFRDIEYTPGNWIGSVFQRSVWEPVGFTQVTHKGGHARTVRTWRLK